MKLKLPRILIKKPFEDIKKSERQADKQGNSKQLQERKNVLRLLCKFYLLMIFVAFDFELVLTFIVVCTLRSKRRQLFKNSKVKKAGLPSHKGQGKHMKWEKKVKQESQTSKQFRSETKQLTNSPPKKPNKFTISPFSKISTQIRNEKDKVVLTQDAQTTTSSGNKEETIIDKSNQEPENVVYKLVKKNSERKNRDYINPSSYEKGIISLSYCLIP